MNFSSLNKELPNQQQNTELEKQRLNRKNEKGGLIENNPNKELSEISNPVLVENSEQEGVISKAIFSLTQKLKTQKPKTTQIPIIKDKLTIQVEKIMEEGLEDAYKELTIVQKQAFKIKGEETANKIIFLLKSTRVKIKKIYLLLLKWLKMLPGINKFYLEQEAKIKADKIISLKNFPHE